MTKKSSVLIAGIAGASLGTEIAKCLSLSSGFKVYGCDISELAYGNSSNDFSKTFLADPHDYLNSIIQICLDNDIDYVIPGGEKPMQQLADGNKELIENEIRLVSNSPAVIKICSDKKETFKKLSEMGFSIPLTVEVTNEQDLDGMSYPCIVKPATGSGGSDSVFLASSKEECLLYAELLRRNGRRLIVQEYIPEDEGEYTIGVLSLSNKEVAGVIAMRRLFNSKLSIAYKGNNGLISSGYSQGLIKRYPEMENQAIAIAEAFGSTGPMNIQGRMKGGKFFPFEINPRFSASTFLRAKAGFNEIEFYFENLITGKNKFNYRIIEGYYLRSFTEKFIPIG